MPIPTPTEKLEWLKPAQAAGYETQCAPKVQQGDYEIGLQVTNDILDEAMEVFVRSSAATSACRATRWWRSSPRAAIWSTLPAEHICTRSFNPSPRSRRQAQQFH